MLWGEKLEERDCPAGNWVWVCPMTGDHLWSDPNGGNWVVNGVAAAAGQYPGMTGSTGDIVLPAAASRTNWTASRD